MNIDVKMVGDFENMIRKIGQTVQIFRDGKLIGKTKASIQQKACFFKRKTDIKAGDEVIVKVSGEKLIVDKVDLIYFGNKVIYIKVKMKK